MKTWRDWVLTWAPALVLLLIPTAFLVAGPIYVAPMGRDLYVALLVTGLVFGIPALVLFLIVLVTRLQRRGKQVALDALEREHRLTAICAAFVVPTLALALTTKITPLGPLYVSLVIAYVAWSVPSAARTLAYRSEIVVRRSPQDTFDFVTNPHNWGRYYVGFEVEAAF